MVMTAEPKADSQTPARWTRGFPVRVITAFIPCSQPCWNDNCR